MTEQEAEALAAQLTRIWVPPAISLDEISLYHEAGVFSFLVTIQKDVSLRCSQGSENPASKLEARFGRRFDLTQEGEPDLSIGSLWCWSKGGKVHSVPHHEQSLELFEQFRQEWMPFFRRGCWLSGCPIEAGAHEKAEWIQGFTREEIEAWNLKF